MIDFFGIDLDLIGLLDFMRNDGVSLEYLGGKQARGQPLRGAQEVS